LKLHVTGVVVIERVASLLTNCHLVESWIKHRCGHLLWAVKGDTYHIYGSWAFAKQVLLWQRVSITIDFGMGDGND
jgi:hypothetical protein